MSSLPENAKVEGKPRPMFHVLFITRHVWEEQVRGKVGVSGCKAELKATVGEHPALAPRSCPTV